MTAYTRRPHSGQAKGKETQSQPEKHDHDHEHDHEHDHGHTHSHGIPLFGHRHSHGEDGHSHSAEGIVQVLEGGGARITIIGLLANLGITGSKGIAGLYMNSAALVADAGHSLSDLLGDFVTLFAWKLSRKPPSERYPYGFGKFEVIGTTTVSLLLTGGAIGIGMHSWTLLVEALSQSVTTLPPGTLHDVVASIVHLANSVPVVAPEHGHEHLLDPNAAWFAAISVGLKEWLYRITKRVADEERSPVLLANAIHHRSDAYSSAVALFAILGTWWFPQLPLDPIGGIIVSIVIFQQGWRLLVSAFHQLTDRGVSPKTREALIKALDPLLPPPSSTGSSQMLTDSQITNHTEKLLGVRDLRAVRAGANMFVDLVAEVPSDATVQEMSDLEAKISAALKEARKEIKEARIRFKPVGENGH
ncbi:cation efflux protein [Obba rivulosa]|uniref:Cation efflux protein n=1 Tax=Obba rivulosa TaxID=1052685 RepID=A0A8E2AYK9_9APHY|nr:cation efflux protein [Obba rivulosa]